MSDPTLGALVHDFFLDYLTQQKGLRQSSVRSYRDTMRLFLPFVAKEARRPISRLTLEDLTLERVLAFLRHIEQDRHNSIATRNQRLAALRTFVEYLGRRSPETLKLCQQVAAIPTKRTVLPETRFIARDQVQSLFERLPELGRFALRDRVLLLFLYNTGARVQEAVDVRVEHLTLEQPAYVRLHGKGNKWRQCPLWQETAEALKALLGQRACDPQAPVFLSASGRPLTRFGVYKRVRHLTAHVETSGAAEASTGPCGSTPPPCTCSSRRRHQRHRGWLRHVSLQRHHAPLRRDHDAHEDGSDEDLRTGEPTEAPWNDDPSLLTWLSSL